MGHKTNAKDELKCALSDITHAQKLLHDAIKTVEKDDNKQLIQDTLANVNEALHATRTSTYGFKD
ncbi:MULTISPECIES: hypothetical protein [Clostridium]|jgi:hypothetical protein|uniref:Uncharacterized protein n=1 Tax=bioreactor metagenome TaxID=1076179 RepID=A0A644W2D9_9ZZZZ|nr:hypothetical protein [Clostridium sp. C8]KLE16514.1 hypothetical protein AAT22_05280 [Clostridium sp. C8]